MKKEEKELEDWSSDDCTCAYDKKYDIARGLVNIDNFKHSSSKKICEKQ